MRPGASSAGYDAGWRSSGGAPCLVQDARIGKSLAAALGALLSVAVFGPGCGNTRSGRRLSEEELKTAVSSHNRRAERSQQVECRRIAITGSRIKKRVCQTVGDREHRSDRDQEEMRRLQRFRPSDPG
ncbi:MAG: hypothetical protein MJD61_21080 [Proteobacteria bacterium]|nr:hypothetical protein [Pseudomonadota bacterium]